jgi:hypothetical protein
MSVEISRNSGEFDPEKVEREAVNILARVNLKLDDLRKYKRVLGRLKMNRSTIVR